MPTVRIGQSEIGYELVRSATARERRITVTPGRIEVVALATDLDDDIAGFLTRKRRWLYDTWREMDATLARRHAVPRFLTGSRVLYRGRKMPLVVRRTDAERATVAYRNGFVVDLPAWAGRNAEALVASELRHWLKQRARRDVADTARRLGNRFGLVPRSIRSVDSVHGWGSCGPEGHVLINWHLIFAPRQVMDYVVAHELAHLRHRSHDSAFWNFLRGIVPDFETPKAWLERHGATLDSAFLDALETGSNGDHP